MSVPRSNPTMLYTPAGNGAYIGTRDVTSLSASHRRNTHPIHKPHAKHNESIICCVNTAEKPSTPVQSVNSDIIVSLPLMGRHATHLIDRAHGPCLGGGL